MKKILLFGFLFFSLANFGAVIYVKPVATGTGSGNSWANASNLQDAINACTASDEVWVMAGNYISTFGTGRDKGFYIYGGVKKIYGGFNGTETLRSERNFKTNITVLSGDNNANDTSNLVPTEATRQDNSYHVISVFHQSAGTSNIIIDGFTISGGNANGPILTSGAGQYYHTRGGALYVQSKFVNDNMTVKVSNCIFENNTGTDVSVVSGYNNSNQTDKTVRTDFTSCIFKNNYSTNNGVILITGASGFRWYGLGTIVNCLFHNNTSVSGASCIYTSASTASGGDYTGTDVDIINSTFTSNTGTSGYTIRTTEGSGVALINNIIYGNGSSTPMQITGTVWPAFNTNIIQGNQIPGQSNSDPLLDSNFKLQTNSPAINSGANSFIPSGVTTDLEGNARIVNSTVDMGAYEYDATLGTEDFSSNSEFKIYPNPFQDYIRIDASNIIKEVDVYTIEGKQILNAKKSELYLGNLNNGMYIVKITFDDSSVAVRKIIKK